MTPIDWDEQTKDEWNLLGFYYERHHYLKQWRFWGSKKGLRKLSEEIRLYTLNPSNEEISEHTHLGPYNYLKIMTWNEPMITDNYIGGTLQNLSDLSSMIKSKIDSAKVGQIIKISTEYSPKSTAVLLFMIMSDDFIPSSIEFN